MANKSILSTMYQLRKEGGNEMTIDKAVEILKFLIGPGMPRINLDERDAVQLGIEALKERQEAIRLGIPLWHPLLPGETK